MSKKKSKQLKRPYTLAIDIGGTYIKMLVLDAHGISVTEYIKETTPQPATVNAVFRVFKTMIKILNTKFDRISAGFPGVVQLGVIKTAYNMHHSWVGVNLQQELRRQTRHPAQVANDADIQGYGDISGKGVELVITLGTGLGSALFLDGKLIPNLELGHHPFQDNQTYEQILGKTALELYGVRQWSKNLKRAITLWQHTFNYNRLYLGGGNAQRIKFRLPISINISNNIEGVLGAIKLW